MGYFRYVHILIGEIHRYYYEKQSNVIENDQPGRVNAVKRTKLWLKFHSRKYVGTVADNW